MNKRSLSVTLLLFCIVSSHIFAQKAKKIKYYKICGVVRFSHGNHMPDPDAKPMKTAGVAREIWIYRLSKAMTNDENQSSVFHTIGKKPLAKITSASDGAYCMYLSPGKYSILINEPGKGLFASIFDGQMNLNPLEVQAGKNPAFDIEINYSAAY